MYLSGMWLGVDLKMDTKDTFLTEIGLCAHNMLTILGPISDMIGGSMWPYNEHKFFKMIMN
jgi:hypothetical protein